MNLDISWSRVSRLSQYPAGFRRCRRLSSSATSRKPPAATMTLVRSLRPRAARCCCVGIRGRWPLALSASLAMSWAMLSSCGSSHRRRIRRWLSSSRTSGGCTYSILARVSTRRMNSLASGSNRGTSSSSPPSFAAWPSTRRSVAPRDESPETVSTRPHQPLCAPVSPSRRTDQPTREEWLCRSASSEVTSPSSARPGRSFAAPPASPAPRRCLAGPRRLAAFLGPPLLGFGGRLEERPWLPAAL
mmetsp:Transcript_48040/g.121237  ORF Transcript_48040/g.121237 Transcript_48040/m.121237 type:complete len:245 (-) Transcript_48040:98-832(-)